MEALQIRESDNVAVALRPIPQGTPLDVGEKAIRARQDIPQGHKIALADIPEGSPVIKYGYPIGIATQAIPPGHWAHTHNVKTALTDTAEFVYRPVLSQLPARPAATFPGYLREDGRAGVRNEIWLIPTVGCVNGVCAALAAECDPLARQQGLDGVFAFPHPYGCSQMSDDHRMTRTALAALVKHPNAGGVLVVGLGCENNTMEEFRAELGSWEESRVRFMVCQQEHDELESGRTLLRELIARAAADKRRPLPASKLVVGMKCGGSDGFSGITANAVVGALTDRLVAMGGSAILTEVPEMFGAEQVLLNRCESEDVFRRAAAMVSGFRDYFVRHGQVVYENPSPGNKDGGITTLEDKSLGCVQKGGLAPVVDVLEYGDAAKKQGLTLLSAPGNDLVSTTALTAAGAQIILFTTGRGTPFGAPAVTLKISTNSDLANKKPGWIDFDAGAVAHGQPIPESADRLLDLVLRTASGEYHSKAEQNGYREIAVFKGGVTV